MMECRMAVIGLACAFVAIETHNTEWNLCQIPVNFYDATWLNRLKEADSETLEGLGIQPAVDLTMDPRIVK